MKFDCSAGEDGLAVLQLRKWGLSEFPYMPSDFREGFISPTRKFLLLHSHNFEALLLPLVKDKCMITKDSEVLPDQKYHDQPEPSHSGFYVSSEKVPCSPEPVGVNTNIGCASGVGYLEPQYGYISHVDSIAWGLCGNTFDHQKEDSFEDLLFVSGKHGVVVHAFPKFSISGEGIKPAQEHNAGQGIQVEWGPSANLSPYVEVQKNSISQLKVYRERINTSVAESMEDGLSSSIPRKIWLNTLFTKVETQASSNGMYTSFPKRPSFTNNMVLSFRIFDEDSELLDFLYHGGPASLDQKNDAMPSSSPIYNKTDVNPNIAGFTQEDYSTSKSESGIIKRSYTCRKVFSNNSHSLVGFALCDCNEKPVNRCYVNGGNYNGVLIAVANLVSMGLHWLFSAKLDENLDPDSGALLDWKDFSFSHRFLICLNASGFISLYGATSGMYVASINVSSINRPTSSLSSQELGNDCHSLDKMHVSSCAQAGSLTCERRFKCLFVIPHSSSLGVMDECSVVYVLVVDDHIPKDHCGFESVLAHQEYPELGLLTRWEVGASEIGYQRDLLDIQVPQDSDLLSTQGTSSLFGKLLHKKHLKREVNIKYQSSRPGFSISNSPGISKAHKMSRKNNLHSDSPSCPTRKVYLPQARQNKDDLVCCSSFGVTRLIRRYADDRKWSQVVHSNQQIDFIVNDETNYSLQYQEASVKEAVGCNFGGFLYLITEEGLSVVLPSISVPSNLYPVEAIGYKISTSYTKYEDYNLLEFPRLRKPWPPWKLEVLDRVLIYEGPEVAAWLCLENGWGSQISRVRHLQLALDYLKFDDIENSLEMLMRADLVVEGILRLLFAAASLMFDKVGNDNEVSAASRLLAMGTVFATRVIRKCGLLQHKGVFEPWDVRLNEGASVTLELTYKGHDKEGNSRSLHEMAQLMVVIRNMQGQLNAKFKRPGHIVTGNMEFPNMVHTELPEDKSTFVSEDALLLDDSESHDIPASEVEPLALIPTNKAGGPYLSDYQNVDGELLVPDGSAFGQMTFPIENTKEMMARWELENLDLKTVVNDALFSGRLPLAVLRLHMHRLNNLISEPETHDTFNDVRIAGRAIAYDLFLKGDTGLAMTTLQKLGEDVETTLKHLVFGTVRRSLRDQVAEQMERYTYLEPHELKRLKMLSLIERVYPCSSFFNALSTRHKEFKGASSDDAPEETSLRISHPLFGNLTIVCGEVDGVVLGAWTNIDEHTFAPEVCDDSSHAAYWAAAVAWSDAWDQSIIDRVLLDQPLLMGVNILWESQLEYHVCHNNWLEVSKLLEVIPSYALSSGSLSISLDDIHSASEYDQELHGYNNYQSFLEELDTVCIDVPGIKVFRFGANRMCSLWLRTLMEKQLAKSLIFLTEYWRGTADIVPMLAQSGFIMGMHDRPSLNGGIGGLSDSLVDVSDVSLNSDAVQALHEVVIRFCSEYNLLNFLDLYLDFHKLANDLQSLSVLQDAAGDNEWAKCLVFMRVKGKEYDASFSNARAIAAHSMIAGNKITVLETGNVIQAVDDIAEGAGEIAALATLMFAPIGLQECLSAGSVNRQCSSAQCTLENLRPVLQSFPTLWNMLIAACFGQDPVSRNSTLKKNVTGYSDLLDSLNWREGVFFSSTRDTSILQMIPGWFPNSVRRLIQLYVQGPIGWQSLADSENGELAMVRDIYYIVSSSGHGQVSALSWESAVHKHIEEELYTSSLEGAGVGLEHHLHRGRALASLNHILSARVHKLKSESKKLGISDNLSSGQSSVQSDVHTLLVPVNQSEESLLSSVVPLAIEHFGDTVLVASCAFLLELCGLSASTLRINIAALRRISSFYKSADNNYRQMSPKASALYSTSVEVDVTESLARALADDYRRKFSSSVDTSSQPSRAILLVLHHLETASLPFRSSGMTCGSWLSSGNGNGADLRSQQKISSQHWQLVTMFCQMHSIPLSTKYLATLARDNDWVGFLSEAQLGKYAFELVIQVASKEISDPRLKVHLLTILKSMLSKKKLSSSSNMDTAENRGKTYLFEENTYIPVELFRILAECEKQEKSGEALLVKAKDLGWSILAMIASCFPDVSQMTCLTVWLEITAARETSAIKINDIASLIAKNVGAAVESTNSLPASARIVTVHYNRKNSKRRRVVEANPVDSLSLADIQVSTDSDAPNIQDVYDRELEKLGDENTFFSVDSDSVHISLSRMVMVLCEKHLFLHLLQAFEIFLPSCSLLPFIRALQAFSQMRLSEASAHLESFTTRIKEESPLMQSNSSREGRIEKSWIISTAVKAAEAMLTTCPSPYDKRCLLRLLAATDFGDGGSTATRYGRLCWKIDMAEPSLRSDDCPLKGNETLDDASLLKALEKNGSWEQARIWASQLEASGELQWKSSTNHVTEMQAQAMVAEWKEFLWDVPEERVALWSHCQALFIKYSFPANQAGLFFLKHAEAAEKDVPTTELLDLLLLALQWLSGMITLSNPCYPLHLLREIETRVWLLAVESEAHVKDDNDYSLTYPNREPGAGKSSLIDRTATVITKMDNHINSRRHKHAEKNDKYNSPGYDRVVRNYNSGFSSIAGRSTKPKKRAKVVSSRRSLFDAVDKKSDSESITPNMRDDSQSSDDNSRVDESSSRWEERVGPEELERAVLSLLDFGQTTAARQLQNKLSPDNMPSQLLLADAALKLASLSTPRNKVSISMLDGEVLSVLRSFNILASSLVIDPLEALENLATILMEGSGRGLCKKIISVVKAANVLGLTFSEAFEKQPIELLQLLTLKAQESFEEANLLVQTHSMSVANIAQVLAESFLKGLLAAHRGGYMDSQKDEGPAPLLWRFSDFLKWAELCPCDSEVGHALMKLVITGQEIPHACEVELLILSHRFYKSCACLDGVDVLVALAVTRVEAYVLDGDFSCLARLITGVGNFHALNFILGILIENGQLDLLLHKYSAAADANSSTAEAVRGFRMAVLTSLKQFNPDDLDGFAMVYNHFDMKHETAALLEQRAQQSSQQWFNRYDKDQNFDLLESMRYFIEAAEVHSSIDAGNKTHKACAQASLVSLQIRMPDTKWVDLTLTQARRILVEQPLFQEAQIVAEAYDLNQPSEWALVLWEQMLNSEVTEQLVADFVAVLPLQPSMLVELARFYRSEVQARGDQSQLTAWLSGGGLPGDWAKYLGRSFRTLLRRTRDFRLKLQLANTATGFGDVVQACFKELDKVPDNAGPLILRKGHGGGYLPLM